MEAPSKIDFDSILKPLRVDWAKAIDPQSILADISRLFCSQINTVSFHIRIQDSSQTDNPPKLIRGDSGKYVDSPGVDAIDSLFRATATVNGRSGSWVMTTCGPADFHGVQILKGESLVIVVLYFPTQICWACMTLTSIRNADNAVLIADISAILSILATRLRQAATEDRQLHARKTFYEELSVIAPSNPTVDLPRLCTAWKNASNADWVWLWVYNDIVGQWEVIAHSADPEGRYVPPILTTPNRECVAEYATLEQRPVYVEDLGSWHETRGATRYSVACLSLLTQLGCQALDCVPLLSPPNPSGTTDLAPLGLQSAVCLHYLDRNRRQSQPEYVLKLMGRISASMIISSFEAEQRQILFSLNALMEKYFSALGIKPMEQRKGYLSDLQALLQRHLNVRYLSLFWHDNAYKQVVCLSTTGLWDTEGAPVTDLSNVSYQRDEHWTGRVFATGEAKVSMLGELKHKPKFSEVTPEARKNQLAWLICPIPFITSHDAAAGPSPRVLGVIRCTENRARLIDHRARNFDSMQVQTLSFISRQIAPVLEAMAIQIDRESTISDTRHDLMDYGRMIADSAESVRRAIDRKAEIPEYELSDLARCASQMLSVVNLLQMDELRGEQLNLSPEPTYLEGDIVARLKAMLTPYARTESNITLSFGDFHGTPHLKIDRVLVERALTNLIVNAVKYGTRGSEVRIMPLVTREECVIAVSNYGIGIEEAEIPILFTKRFRGAKAKQLSMGSGLGLHIAKMFMTAQGGDLILSQPKNPTIFSMIFPRKLIVD